MKKIIISLLCLCLVGCSNVSKKEYEHLVHENKELQVAYNQVMEDLNEFESKLENKEDVKISGGFVATVRDVMPDNCVDDFTSRLVLLQWFQGDTFVLRIDEKAVEKNLGEKLENKRYYFEIEPVVVKKECYNMSVEDVNDMLSASMTVHNWIKIKDFREVNDDEGGLNSWFINVEPVK